MYLIKKTKTCNVRQFLTFHNFSYVIIGMEREPHANFLFLAKKQAGISLCFSQ